MNINDLKFEYHSVVWATVDVKGYVIWQHIPTGTYDIGTKARPTQDLYGKIGALELQCILNLISEGKEIPTE